MGSCPFFFFFKHKTAYEMRISDWSSDVCSADLLLLGANSQEGYYPDVLHQQPPTPANYRAALQRLFGAQAPRALALYPGNDEATIKRAATALAGDLFIAHSTWRWMDLHRRSGNAPVYFYRFDQPRPAKRSEEHTSELQSLMRISYAVFC